MFNIKKIKSQCLSAFDDFIRSGHDFSVNNSLEKFRFSLLNAKLVLASFFTLVNYFSALLGFVEFDPFYEKALLFYALTCSIGIFPLRLDKRYYSWVANSAIFSALVVFYSALFLGKGFDEFRLIWFFLTVMAGFVLMGRNYGLTLMLLILSSLIAINFHYELGFTELAKFTFVNSLLIFSVFSYFFLSKIEKDAVEFKQLNKTLSESIEKEIEQREVQEQMLLQQYRMANMGGMLDAIAHQWRQPLMNINAVLMNMDYSVRNKVNDTGYLVAKIEEVSSLTDHMSQTIEDFRGLLKEDTDQTILEIEHAVNEVLVLLKNSLNDVNVSFHIEPCGDIIGHKSELMQVIIILLSNAIEALLKKKIESKKIAITIASRDQHAFIEIEDNAGGINSSNMGAIFDPYFTTKEQSGGTGLGLYIAKIITEQRMGGQISASNTHSGAKFTLSFTLN